jgi:hypothetical protein
VQTLVKQLASNELGHTGGHQRGGVLIPKHCVRFFPSLGPPPNPEIFIPIRFLAMGHTISLRIVYYEQGTRNEYRLTPVPHEVLRGVRAGDYFLIRDNDDGTYTGGVAKVGESLHLRIQNEVRGGAGRITPTDYLSS